MTDHQINQAIAEACGWKRCHTERSGFFVIDPQGHQRGWSKLEDVAISAIPDYCNDLNAMHEAVSIASHYRHGFLTAYTAAVSFVVKGAPILSATARQQAEAFLRTIGKWRDA